MSKRLTPWLILFTLLGVAVLGVVDRVMQERATRTALLQAEAESFHILAQARDSEDLEKAVGDLEIVFRLRDGGWLAIRYRDCHAGRMWSSAVARDGGGSWFVSDSHYCGRFLT